MPVGDVGLKFLGANRVHSELSTTVDGLSLDVGLDGLFVILGSLTPRKSPSFVMIVGTEPPISGAMFSNRKSITCVRALKIENAQVVKIPSTARINDHSLTAHSLAVGWRAGESRVLIPRA
jgi:ABC-type branched-subunit amino acid transport system ATPase component